MIELVDYNDIYGKGVESKEETAVKKTRRAGSRKKSTAAATVTEAEPVVESGKVKKISKSAGIDKAESVPASKENRAGIETPEEDAAK